ncbi:MAG: lipoprotein insertase outer membrane protein LolB [Shewanella sp.]
MNNLKRFTKSILSCIALSTLLFLPGCQTLPPVDDLSAITVSKASQAAAWELQGKLAIKTSADKLSANLYWRHTPRGDKLTLTTMLGTTVLTLHTTADSAQLEFDGKTYHDSNAERLLKRVSGWSIPLDALPLWIVGLAGPLDEIVERDGQAQPKELINQQTPPPWQVSFLSWQSQSGASVPRQLTLVREDLQLKLQLNQWQALGNVAALIGEHP